MEQGTGIENVPNIAKHIEITELFENRSRFCLRWKFL